MSVEELPNQNSFRITPVILLCVMVSFGGILQIGEKVGPEVGFSLHGEEEKPRPAFHLFREFWVTFCSSPMQSL